jgi:CheY-like chemotaxis protein/anti-sigma regulatory factor (Ser/Thr protein kinase)
MASGIAHDINNAISPASLYVESVLEKESGLSPRSREYLTTVLRAVDDVAQTVSRLREFYRQREPQLILTPVAVNPLAGQVAELTRARWGEPSPQRAAPIEMKLQLAPGLPPIMCVESEIREALTNLVFNAVDALPDGGTITLRTRLMERPAPGAGPEPEVRVCVEVSDTGMGMDEETKRRCLEPFYTTKGERGTGLGLAMVYGTVQRHGAEIEIDSTPGRDTTFRMLFPPPPDTEEFPAAAAVPPVPPRRRLLVVDDDEVLLKSLTSTLQDDGHEVVAAGGGQAGIEVFLAANQAGRLFDAVITDLGMPQVDGRQVAAAVKSVSPATPVLLLTGWGQRLTEEGDIPPNVDRILNKPTKLGELREALAFVGKPKT